MTKKRRKDARSKGAEPLGPAVPPWAPAVLFAVLTLVLFREFVFGDRMLFGNDTLGLGYVARAFYADALETLGTIPRWAPLILGGTPFIEALASGDSLYPPSALLLLLMDPHRALGWKLVVHFFAAGLLMVGWLRQIGASRSAAILGGTAYMLAPYFVSLVMPGHDGKIFVTALAPLLFWTVERHFVKAGVRSIAAIALVIGLILLTTHFQMAYFLFGAVGMYAIFRSVQLARAAGEAGSGPEASTARSPLREGGLPFALFLAASLLGAGVAAVQLLPAIDYVTESSRRVQTTRDAAGESGVAWSSSWSLHPEEVVALVIPEFAGNNARTADWTQGTYWGRNGHKDNHEGAGVVILLLAAVSFVGGSRRALRFFFAGLAAVALLFALGAHTPVWGFFYAVVPGIRLFRAPSQVMFLFAFSAATLGALGLDRLLALRREGHEDDWTPVNRVMIGGAAGLALLALLASTGTLTSLWTSVVHPGVSDYGRQQLAALEPFIARGAGFSFLLGAAALGVTMALRAGKVPVAAFVGIVVALVAVDAMRTSTAFVRTLDYYQWAAPDGFVELVLDRERGSTEPYRMLSFRNAGQDVMPALHGIELAGGHHPNDLSRYRELIGMVGSGLPVNLADPDIRALVNVRYVLWPDYELGPAGQAGLDPAGGLGRSQLQDGSTYNSLYAEAGLPRARLVGSAVVRSDAEAVPYMLSDAFDPASEVVLSEPSPIELDGLEPDGAVSWVERTPNRLELEVSTARPALLVVADNWFPAWKVRVDGEEAPLLRAYHTLRAVPVPAGDHTVEMVYDSTLVGRSGWISLLVTLGLFGAVLAQWIAARRRAEAPS